MSKDNELDNEPDFVPDVKDLLLYQINEYFYEEEDLGTRRVKFQEGEGWISISITTHGFGFNTYKLSDFNEMIRSLGYKFGSIYSKWNNNRLHFVLHKIED